VESVGYMYMAQDREEWQELVKTKIKFGIKN
jgi:23S rRNA maturation mini-RNase III